MKKQSFIAIGIVFVILIISLLGSKLLSQDSYSKLKGILLPMTDDASDEISISPDKSALIYLSSDLATPSTVVLYNLRSRAKQTVQNKVADLAYTLIIDDALAFLSKGCWSPDSQYFYVLGGKTTFRIDIMAVPPVVEVVPVYAVVPCALNEVGSDSFSANQVGRSVVLKSSQGTTVATHAIKNIFYTRISMGYITVSPQNKFISYDIDERGNSWFWSASRHITSLDPSSSPVMFKDDTFRNVRWCDDDSCLLVLGRNGDKTSKTFIYLYDLTGAPFR